MIIKYRGTEPHSGSARHCNRLTGSIAGVLRRRTIQSRNNQLSSGHPSNRDITPFASMRSTASFRLSQCAPDRPVKEDSVKIAQVGRGGDLYSEICVKSLKSFRGEMVINGEIVFQRLYFLSQWERTAPRSGTQGEGKTTQATACS